MDAVPRITRAQKLDALSSMANIAGYRAVIEAANQFGRFFTGQITAAGKVPPAKVLVIGAGVAGLAAIGAARGLGAIVRAFDTRAGGRGAGQSMGAEFLEVELVEERRGRGRLRQGDEPGVHQGRDGAVPRAGQGGRHHHHHRADSRQDRRRCCSSADLVEAMKPGSVIVDLAAEQGGNCELTQPGKVVDRQRRDRSSATPISPAASPSTSSQLYGTNIAHLLDDLGGAEGFHLDLDDEVTARRAGRARGQEPSGRRPSRR